MSIKITDYIDDLDQEYAEGTDKAIEAFSELISVKEEVRSPGAMPQPDMKGKPGRKRKRGVGRPKIANEAIRVNFLVEEQELKALRRVCWAYGIQMSEVIRRLIRWFLENPAERYPELTKYSVRYD